MTTSKSSGISRVAGVSEDQGVDVGFWVKAVVWGGKVLRTLGGRRLVHSVKHYLALQALAPLHVEAVHKMRRLSIDVLAGDRKQTVRQAKETCTAMRNTMANLLDLDEHELHCSIKVFTPSGKVTTFARSAPLGDRPLETDGSIERPVEAGSPWCALVARDDGKTRWEKHKCFACNDLPKADGNHFLTIERPDWQRFYKSVLVYPLINHDSNQCQQASSIFGFLCFDSPRIGVFSGMPDIFDYRGHEQRAEYHKLLSQNALFHMGAILADTLSVFLSPLYFDRQQDY